MSSINARIWAQQQVGYFPHTSVSGDAWQFIQRGTATSAGAADGTTVIDTAADSGGADTYNGAYWVRCLSGANKGLWKRVIDDDGAGTLTLENAGFPAQVASAVEYEIWKSPEPVVVVDSSGGETDMVDAVRTEADVDDAPFWVGYYAVPITGARRGKIAMVTGCTAATGTFVLAAGLGGALAAGDVVLLRKFIEVGSLSLGLTESYNARPQNRVNFSMGDGIVGVRGGTVGFSSQAIGSGTLSASGSAAAASALNGLLQACGLEESVGTSVTVGAGSTTSAVKIATGTWEKLAVGQIVIHNGNARRITSLEDGGGAVDTVNVSPALPVAPAAAETLYATRMYAKSTDGDTLSCGIEVEIDGVRHTMTGCKGSVTVQGEAVLDLAFAFNVDHWIREIEAAPYGAASAYASAAAILATDRVVYLDSTRTDIAGFTATPGTATTGKMVQGAKGINGRAGYHVTNYAAGATFRELLSSSGDLDQDIRFQARTAKAVLVVFGGHGNCCCITIPVARIIESPMVADASGMVDVPNVIQAQDAGTATDGASVLQKMPDFAIHLS
jgi:hypothetical protein